MLQSYIKATKLRCWLSRPDCPPVIRECKILFDRMYAPKSATRPDEELAEDPFDDNVRAPVSTTATAVPEDLYTLIKRRTAILRARLKFDGIFYSRASTHVGNSQVLFYPQGDRLLSHIPGTICHIYAAPTGELVFAVQRYILLARHNRHVDPFAMYPGFPAKLYLSSLSSHLESVKVAWVVGHFARWEVSSDQAVVLSLSRISDVPPISEIN
ncbi:hypothetical protein DFH29DRAFT_807897 [Suillus ampliporus]|nr:hypothetical protein DFH29DRAFT_807897 [Suillus ampliporus]